MSAASSIDAEDEPRGPRSVSYPVDAFNANAHDHAPIFLEHAEVPSSMPKQDPRKPGSDWIAHLVPIGLVIISLALLATPGLALLTSLGSGVSDWSDVLFSGTRLQLLARSLVTVGIIAFLAVVPSYAMARVLIGARGKKGVLIRSLLICPLWLPPFMIYAAGNLLRAPDTLLGRAVINYATSSPDLRWVTIWVGYGVAVLGLALWASPLGAVIIASGFASRSGVYDDLIELEPMGWFKRITFQLRMHRALLVRAFVLIAIVMLGSAVPLHLAQLDTWSIVIWRELSESAPSQWGRVWVSSIPMLFIAIAGAWIIRGFLKDQHTHEAQGHQRLRVSTPSLVIALGVVICAVLLPIAAMLISLDDLRSIGVFWDQRRASVFDTGRVAIVVAACSLLIALASAYAAGSPIRAHRRTASSVCLALCVLGLMPGVLVGAAIAKHRIIGIDLPVIAPLWASLTRFSFIGAIIGMICAASESPDRRSARVQVAGASIRAWIIATMPGFLLPLLATLPIVFLLSMFEIEAAIMVTPPGIQSLPQQLLSDLHYTRLEQLSAAGVSLLSAGLLMSIVGSALMMRGFHRSSQATMHH
jgi:ABC-type Fe3+ transport system permease subunit